MNSKQALSEWLIFKATAPRASSPQREPVIIDAFLWESLFENQPTPKLIEPAYEPPPFTGDQPDLYVPAGFQDPSELDRLIEAPGLFSGLVISIAVSQLESLASLQNYLLSLMRLNDFACQDQKGRFLLICPGRIGVEAQKHLRSLSERVWEFQLRSKKTWCLASLGGVDVEREPLGDAIASARERMNQTQRTRLVCPPICPKKY